MVAASYPFIDIAVHEKVRGHYAAGDALALFTAGMERALWANGAGAALFGFSSVYDFIEQGTASRSVFFRQFQAAARRLESTGESRSFLVRTASGFRSTTANATAEIIKLADGERAILVCVPANEEKADPRRLATGMLAGLDEPDTHMAVLDGEGAVIAASTGFEALGITPHTARALATLVTNDPAGLVKRPMPTAKGYLPAAAARIAANLHLVFIVEPAAEAPDEPVKEEAAPRGYEAVLSAVSEIETVETETEDLDLTMPGADAAEPVMVADAPAEEAPAQDAAVAEPLATETVAETQTEAEGVEEEAPSPSSFVFDPARRTFRFVWKTDAEGRFSEVSGEFADAVGPNSADIKGKPLTALASRYGFDKDGKIAEALARRDTWSGKTVYWPVEGTRLKVPVDLAALPAYSRAREFDGFRGFGIVRPGDAIEDEDAIGLTILPEGVPEETPAMEPSAPMEEAPPAIEAPALEAAALLDAIAPQDGVVRAQAPQAEETSLQEGAQEESEATAEPVEDEDALAPVAEKEEYEPAAEAPATVEEADPVVDAVEAAVSSNEMEASTPVDEAEETTLIGETEPDAPADDAESGEPVDPPAAEQPVLAEETEAADTAQTGMPQEAEWPEGEPPALRFVEKEALSLSDKIVSLEQHRARSAEGLSPGEQAAFREIGRKLEAFRGPETEQTEKAGTPEAEIPPATAETVTPPAAPEEQTSSPPEAVQATSVPEAQEAEPETPTPPLEPTPFIAPRSPQAEGLTPAILAQMPVALLVLAGDELYHANPEFLRLTGYDSLDAVREVGGLDALLQRSDLDGKELAPGTMIVVCADDEILPVTARLQSVRWEGASALLLALMPLEVGKLAKPQTPADAPPTTGIAPADTLPAAPVGPPVADASASEVAQLRVETEELRSILETATDGVVILGPEGEIRSMNRSACALFNYDDEETSGKPFVMLFAHESQRAVADYLSGLSGNGVMSVLNDGREVIGREASGGFLPLFMTIGRLTSSNGYCAVMRDITQWKRSEEELRSAKRAAETANAHKTDFLARVSHEIRTPLNAIIGFADLLASEHFGPAGHPRYVEYANDIGRSGRHVLDIVNDLLDISKIEAGEMDLEFSAVNLNETIAEAVSLVQPQANGQRVIIRTALSQAVPAVVADMRSVKQIVLNILANSIRFTPAGGQIVVSTAYEPNGGVTLRIRDTGIGMTRAELDQAMKPFRQATSTPQKRGEGTGLGLPLTKAMTEANRASFVIQSAPNEGTLVEIAFPPQRVLAN